MRALAVEANGRAAGAGREALKLTGSPEALTIVSIDGMRADVRVDWG